MKTLDLKGFLMKECVPNLVDQDNLLYDFRQIAVNDDAGLSTFPHTEAFTTVWISSKRKLLNNNMHSGCKAVRITFLIFCFYFINSVSYTFWTHKNTSIFHKIVCYKYRVAKVLYENTDTYESLSVSVFFFFRPNVFLASILQERYALVTAW